MLRQRQARKGKLKMPHFISTAGSLADWSIRIWCPPHVRPVNWLFVLRLGTYRNYWWCWWTPTSSSNQAGYIFRSAKQGCHTRRKFVCLGRSRWVRQNLYLYFSCLGFQRNSSSFNCWPFGSSDKVLLQLSHKEIQQSEKGPFWQSFSLCRQQTPKRTKDIGRIRVYHVWLDLWTV